MIFTGVHHAAREYIKRGFRVIPLWGVDPVAGGCLCGSPLCKERDWGKHEPPATDGQWKDGRTFTEADFGELSNIAIAMGPWKDRRWLVALDCDGCESVAEFFPAMPPTLTQRTPRGRHYIYTVAEYEPLGNYVDVFKTKRAGYSLDLRYARGRVVVAPSRGATGDYAWLDWRAPAPLPSHALATILHQRRTQKLPVADRWHRGSKDP